MGIKSSVFYDFISLFFPAYCYSCNQPLYKSEECICLRCKHELAVTNYQEVLQNPVFIKMYGKAPVSFGISFLRFVKSGKTQRLLHLLKYHNKPEIGNILGRWYAKDIEEIVSKQGINLILPVPLHKNKKKKRGYNQSDGFAESLSEKLNIEINTELLVRIKHNATQTNKSKMQRWENVEKIFRIREGAEVIGKHILVVDDVITTGSTLASCATELLDNGASSVSIAAIAVAE